MHINQTQLSIQLSNSYLFILLLLDAMVLNLALFYPWLNLALNVLPLLSASLCLQHPTIFNDLIVNVLPLLSANYFHSTFR
jgi:hypothetical protein